MLVFHNQSTCGPALAQRCDRDHRHSQSSQAKVRPRESSGSHVCLVSADWTSLWTSLPAHLLTVNNLTLSLENQPDAHAPSQVNGWPTFCDRPDFATWSPWNTHFAPALGPSSWCCHYVGWCVGSAKHTRLLRLAV